MCRHISYFPVSLRLRKLYLYVDFIYDRMRHVEHIQTLIRTHAALA